jgi:proline utilization trans-activator
MRILLVHGYHTDISFRVNNKQDLLRCQNTWWTVYVLERRISVLLGVPLGISDNDISTSLPIYSDSPFQTSTMALHVKLSQAFSQVVNGILPEGPHCQDEI